MKIRNVRHKGLRRLMEDDDVSGLPAQHIDKIRKMLAFLQDMAGEDELYVVPAWRPHLLRGNRQETWTLSVTRNWRITFRVDRTEGDPVGLDYEDYR